MDSYWIAGFTSGEGCFYIRLANNSTFKLGTQVQLTFTIGQHDKDKMLMNDLISYLDCGQVSIKKNSKYTWLEYSVTKFSDIDLKIIPFFREYKVVGVKSQDFQDWSLAAKLIKNKAHLTDTGLEEIKVLKGGMNKGRGLHIG